jgi:hypothetical protein
MHRVFSLRSLIVAAWLLCGSTAWGEISVRSQLTHRSVETGTAAQLHVIVSGHTSETVPPDVTVDGLDIEYLGPSTSRQISIVNGQMSSRVQTTHVFQIIARNEGDFTIPALEVQVEGRSYRTQPIGLKAVKPSTPAGDPDAAPRHFAEISIGKKTAWLGEVLPVELRLYVDGRIRLEEVTHMPELTGDGFTMQKFPRFEQERETRDGREYNVVVFRTVMVPGKAGKLKIGPCEIPFVGQIPVARARNRNRSVFDSLFGDDDFFGQLRGYSERRRLSGEAEAVEIEIKPLPADGRPASFTGAVGQFQFAGEGSPSQVKIGEPVTMRLSVSGEGNFDRVQAPGLVDAAGWQAYEARENFEPGNELKTTGTKTFEIPVIPEKAHRTMPVFEFAYFDPAKGSYVALRNSADPLHVDGAPPQTPEPAPAPAASQPGEPIADAQAPAKPGAGTRTEAELLGPKAEPGRRATWSPITQRPLFWMLQALPAAIALGLCAARWLHQDPAQARLRALRAEKQRLFAALQRAESDADFIEKAARFVQLDTAIAAGVEPGSVDAIAVQRLRRLDAEAGAAIDRIFEQRAALLYAGAGGQASSGIDRAEVLAALSKLSAS